jgi:hypothetical protein
MTGLYNITEFKLFIYCKTTTRKNNLLTTRLQDAITLDRDSNEMQIKRDEFAVI